MDFKLLIHTILLGYLSIHQLSANEDLHNFTTSKFDYYLTIKSSADRQQVKQWKNAVCPSYLMKKILEIDGPWRAELDEEDTCLLYLVKNQSSPVVHGPVVIDSKLIDLDMKYDPNNLKLSDYPSEYTFYNQKQLENCSIAYARCALSKVVYQHLWQMPKFPVLHTYLELEPKLADHFPKIEKNDYFILNIINRNFDKVENTKLLISLHIISNYTILPKQNSKND